MVRARLIVGCLVTLAGYAALSASRLRRPVSVSDALAQISLAQLAPSLRIGICANIRDEDRFVRSETGQSTD